jgi:hypothetical protein
MFQKNMLPPFSGSRSKPSKQQIEVCLLRSSHLLGLLFDPEDGGCMFVGNISKPLLEYMALHPRR